MGFLTPCAFFTPCALLQHGAWNPQESGRNALKSDFNQRQRDDNKNKTCTFEGGGLWEQRGKSSKNAAFRGKRHDNKILKVQILLSRNFVVMAQAPI